MTHAPFTLTRTSWLHAARLPAALLALACALPAAWADSRQMPESSMLPAYKQECAGCHMA